MYLLMVEELQVQNKRQVAAHVPTWIKSNECQTNSQICIPAPFDTREIVKLDFSSLKLKLKILRTRFSR